jgi:membrane fusion protein, multidrug efflux system
LILWRSILLVQQRQRVVIKLIFNIINKKNSISTMQLSKLALCILTFISLIYGVGCTLRAEKNTNITLERQSIPVYTIKSKDTILQKEYVSAIKAKRNVEIRSHMKGFLEQIFVDEGAYVKKGQLLFRLNDQELRAEAAKAQANIAVMESEVNTMQTEVNRVLTLVDKKVISDTELSVAKAKLNAAQARVQEAKSHLNHIEIKMAYTKIKAPFDGFIDRIPMKIGSLVDEGALLTTISDVTEMYAYFEVSENEYLALQKAIKSEQNQAGTPVQLQLADGSIYPQNGKIETMTGQFGESTGSIAFRAMFSNPKKLLKHGASGKVLITKPQDDVLLIPQKAVFEIQDKSYVFVIGADNSVKTRSFVPKNRLTHYYVVQDGLREGEKIAAEGVQHLRDGMIIQPVNQ